MKNTSIKCSLFFTVTGEMLREWRERMTAASNEGYGHVKKMYLYSGHDVTLMNVMRGLGFDTMELTDYGSSLHIQLWHSIQNGYHVQVCNPNPSEYLSANIASPNETEACSILSMKIKLFKILLR